jgi:hypothetical protein
VTLDGRSANDDDQSVRRTLLLAGATLVAVAGLTWALHVFGPRSTAWAFVVVWAPMAWLGTISRLVTPRLPASYHELRRFEADGRVYELLGVGVAKWLLRRGPLAFFNPGLRLPGERTPDTIARLDQRMRDAEASHAILLVLTMGVVAHAGARGWWVAAAWTLLFDVLLNGYPVMLQRYNRGLLQRRFGTAGTAGAAATVRARRGEGSPPRSRPAHGAR